MIVQFDEVSATRRVVADDGTIIMDGFATDAAAWRWADAHSEADQRDAVTQDRISTAIRRW